MPSEVIVQADGSLKIVPHYQRDNLSKVIASTEDRTQTWGTDFCEVGLLNEGGTKMLIDNFMPEGTTFIGALPGCGKTFFALSICRALTTGKPFLGRFPVREIIPVLYLAPESSGSSFRARCEKFGIPNDRERFLCRTNTEGATLSMSDPAVLAAVKSMKPLVVLDTVVRFNKSSDENSASANKILCDEINGLKAAGARGILCLHHATKSSRTDGLTLESALRGSGDMAAIAQAVYGLRRNEALFDDGNGPVMIQVRCLKDPEFEPPLPFEIAAKVKENEKLVSCIDTTGDFVMIEAGVAAQELSSQFVRLIDEHPDYSFAKVAEALGISKRKVQSMAEKLKIRRDKTGWIFGNVKTGTSTDPVTSKEIAA